VSLFEETFNHTKKREKKKRRRRGKRTKEEGCGLREDLPGDSDLSTLGWHEGGGARKEQKGPIKYQREKKKKKLGDHQKREQG